LTVAGDLAGAPLPSKEETGMDHFADRSFSDHCGLLVRFSE